MRAVVSVLATLVAASCAPRAPVLNLPPKYPDFAFPAVPADLAATGQTAQHGRAWQLLQAGDFRSATAAFTDVLNRAPGFYPAEAGLGYIAMAQQSYDTAVERFSRVLDRSPAYVPALLGRAEAYLAANRDDEALSSFEAALKADPRLSAVQRRVEELRFGRMTMQMAAARRAVDAGRYSEARAAYERVIAASPESAFLYLELAEVEQRERNLARALELAAKAAELDPADVAPLVLQGEVYEAQGDVASAERAYQRALDLDPSVDVGERLARIHERARLESLPAQYRGIPVKTRISRGELAALVGVRFEALMDEAARGRTIIVTDARNHWANRWILSVATAAVMDANVNHQFQPERVVTRGELAQTVARMLDLVEGRAPARVAEWRRARPTFSDMGPGHLSYPFAAQTVAAGVLTALENNSFQPTRPVTGPEAVEALDHLEQLFKSVR